MPFSQNSPCHPSPAEHPPSLEGLATIETAAAQDVIDSVSKLLAPAPRSTFLTCCAFVLQHALCADYFVISRLNPYSNIMRAMRFVVDGALAPNFTYNLDGTPCARAMDGGVCVYPENVAGMFPRDRFLADEDISGYAGAAMKDRAGNPLGVMLALSRKPILESDAARAVLEYFSIRVACAIDTAELIDRQDRALAVAVSGVWDWDVVTGGTVLSESVIDLLGFRQQRCYDLSSIENAIHPDDRARHAQALRDHLSGGPPFSVTVRLKTAADGWRWHLSRGEAERNEKGRAVRVVGCFVDVDDVVSAAEAQPRPAAGR